MEHLWLGLWAQAAYTLLLDLGLSLFTNSGTTPAFIKQRKENIFKRG